jgi:hypothetical protein
LTDTPKADLVTGLMLEDCFGTGTDALLGSLGRTNRRSLAGAITMNVDFVPRFLFLLSGA